ncbi:MAG: hypothetical protein ACRD0G_14425 [Acidimicrobiales bacterium]
MPMSRRHLLTGAGALAAGPLARFLGLGPVAQAATGPGTVPLGSVINVDAGRQLRPLTRHLVGFGWHEGGAPLASIAPLHPHLIRIDASLQDMSAGPGAPLDLDALLARVAAARAVGGEPLVILAYVPAWLGEPSAVGRDPTRVRPANLDAWERLVHDVVLALATAEAPAQRFEAWNEPDIPLFWQDTPVAWVDTVERSARAVAAVERETGLALAFGGPATAFPDPLYLLPFLARFRDPALPLNFLSWHYYANYPFLGPDGAEFPVTEPVHPLVGLRNPLASPAAYRPQVGLVRALADLALAGTGRPPPALVIDEWNLSAGGFDTRHDTAEGAAFAAGVLIELQDAGLDEAAFFVATDVRGVPGEHGTVTLGGTRKPVWWTFELWQHLEATQVAATEAGRPVDGLWSVATAGRDRVVVLVAAFQATAGPHPDRTIVIELQGLAGAPASATLRRIDAAHGAADTAEPGAIDGTTVCFRLPTPGVAMVEVRADGQAVSA